MLQLPSLLSLKAFIIVSQYSSFTKAAEVLHVTQGAVSRQIKQLEESLGVPLFIRDHHSLRLTADGRKLLPYFTQALEKIFEGVSTIEAGDKVPASHLSLNVAPSFSTRWLVPRLVSFCHKYPKIDFTITTEYSPDGNFLETVDCQVRFGLGPLSGFKSLLLFEERNVLVGRPELQSQTLNLPRLLSTNVLLHILNGHRRLDVWEHWLALTGLESQVDPSGGIEFSTQDQVINAAIAGVGIALLDKFMIQKELDASVLAVLSPLVSSGPYGYWFDVRPEKSKDPQVMAFSEWLLDMACREVEKEGNL